MILQIIYADVKNIFHKIMVLVINVELDVQNVIRLNAYNVIKLNIGLLMVLDVNVMLHIIQKLTNVFNVRQDVFNVLMEIHVKLVIKLTISLRIMVHANVLLDIILMKELVIHVLIIEHIVNNAEQMEKSAIHALDNYY